MFSWSDRLVACALVGLIVAGIAIAGLAVRSRTMDAKQKAILEQLDHLAADAPLESWLPYTALAGMPAVVSRARETICTRPHLTFDLVGCLRRDDAPMRALALNFVRGGGLPPLNVESIPDARDALGAEVASMRAQVEAHTDTPVAAFDPECLEAVFLVARYPGRETAFVKPLREMHAVIDQLPCAKPLPAGQEELERWLRLNDPNGNH